MNVNESPVLTVGVLCGYVKRIFESEELLRDVTVLGEVSNFKITGGYAYFNLKDGDGLLPCVCFGLYKTQLPKDGDKVFVSGSISFYPKGGKVSFIVDKISYTGQGELLLFYQRLKEKLQSEGIFDESHKKEIPSFISSVCIVTSKSGAVLHDIYKTIRAKNSLIDVFVSDTKVQGEGAEKEIVKAIELADKKRPDVIILARGGGSYEDLLAFCDENVVRAVYDCKTPIISAVGHETDLTLVDYASDLRVSTPTAAGEYIAWSESEIKSSVLSILNYIYNKSKDVYSFTQQKTMYCINNLSHIASYFYEKNKNRFTVSVKKMNDALRRQIDEKSIRASLLMSRIESANPITTLKKGLYKVYKDNEPLDVSKIKKDDKIVLETIGATINATVNNVTKKLKGEYNET